MYGTCLNNESKQWIDMQEEIFQLKGQLQNEIAQCQERKSSFSDLQEQFEKMLEERENGLPDLQGNKALL